MSEHPEASKHDDEEEQQQSSGTSFLKVILVLLFIVAGLVVLGIVGYFIYNAYAGESKKGTELKDLGGFKAESNFAPGSDKQSKEEKDGEEENGSKKKKKSGTSLREGLEMRNSQMIMANKEVPLAA